MLAERELVNVKATVGRCLAGGFVVLTVKWGEIGVAIASAI
ncbi:hypothetical protein [Bradyrhizobium sp. th.b2]|nr:hypothetical protein [Bradyrhizobium sp. th.b2]